MSYQVIARKWRPQTFAEVVGQDLVARTLQNAIRSNRIAHAFLFSGVRGVGKTTIARILAKALNCREGLNPEPCGECVSCQEIRDGNSVDVQEIDAASNRGIDSIRELRESVRYGTARDRYKIFIVDEVHMLTNEAFNALLKTLEEPPEHVKFILATTESQKIPVTIASRCQHYEFRPIAFPLLLERLRMITSSEEIKISDEALRSLASVAQGSMRDAQSSLDQIIAYSGKEIEDDDVRALLGIVDQQLVIRLVDKIADQDRQGLLAVTDELRSGGVLPLSFGTSLLEYLRDLMVVQVVGWDAEMLQLGESMREVVEEQAAFFSELDLIRFYDTLSLTCSQLRWHSHPLIHLEMCLLKLVELARLPSIEKVIGHLESGDVLVQEKENPESAKSANYSQKSQTFWNSPTVETAPRSTEEADVETLATSDDVVERMMTALQTESMRLYQNLQRATEIFEEEGKLTIRFPVSEKFHASEVQAVDNWELLLKLASTVTGRPVPIEVEIIGEPEAGVEVSDPTADPKIKTFLKKYPGKVIIKRESQE